MEERTAKSYLLIFKNIMEYLPSRILIILNSIIIIPLFAHLLDEKQMSIYLIAIQILNILLTCTFDWITKAVLRFYEKYRYHNSLNAFFSSIFWLSIFAYLLIFISYFFLKDFVCTKFAIDNLTFLLTIFLVIPCSIRQFLYQILRIRNKAKLYTLSIILYQFGFVSMFACLFKILPYASSILIAMNIVLFLIDVYIIRSIEFKWSIKPIVNKSIIFEVLKYALPLIFTNSCYWYILNFSKLIFQNQEQYLNTAICGTAWLLANSITPFMTVFIFATFPTIVKQFEMKKRFKQYFTNMLQLYCFILIPFVSFFCFFSREITGLILPKNYAPVAYVLPFFALATFLHELLKLINIKYHLKIKTYIEMFIAGTITIFTLFMNITLIDKYAVLGAGLALFISELALIIANICIEHKTLDYVNYKSIAKTFICVSLIGLTYFFILNGFVNNSILKIVLYASFYIPTCLLLRKQILS